MTSALQFLYILRSRSRSRSRRSERPNENSNPCPNVCRCSRDRRHGGSSKIRYCKSCGSHVERDLRRSSRVGSEGYRPCHRSNGGVSNSIMLTRLGLTRNDQLPVDVEEARIRLLERLRSFSLTDNRQRASNDQFLSNESTNLAPEILRQRPNSNILNSESTLSIKKKVPVPRWDVFCEKKGEIFMSSEENYEGGVMSELSGCCICMEGFKDGDLLIKLCCSHKFHPDCLEPWVRSSGDCPLCRADII